jgi:hypothetical protein
MCNAALVSVMYPLGGSFCSIVEAVASKDSIKVRAHSVLRYAELDSDLFVGKAVRDQPNNGLLPYGKVQGRPRKIAWA